MTMETELGKNGTTSLIDVLQQHDSTSESSSTILFFNICILLDMKSVSSLRHTCSRCNALLEHISEQFFSYHIDHFLFTRHDFHASVLNSKPLSQYLREQFYTLPAHHEQVTTELEPNNLSSSLHQDLARLNQQPLLENSNSPFETNDHFFRDLFKEFICTPLIDMNYEETDVNFKKYLGLGGVVRVTLYKPCRLLETVLSLVFKNHVSNEEPFQWNEQTYTKTNHHRKRKVAFHKFALLASLFPLLTSSSIHIKVEPCENMGHNEPLTTLLKTTPGGLLSWMYNGQVHPHDEWSESEDEEEIYQEGEYQTESDEDDASDDFGEFTQVPEGYFHSECFIHFQIPPHILSLNPYMERVLKYHHVSNTPHEERIEDFRRCDIFKYCARPPNSLYLRKGQEQKMEQVLANIREYLFNTNYEGNHIFDWSGTIERRKCWSIYWQPGLEHWGCFSFTSFNMKKGFFVVATASESD
ncbi:hypothetical protein C9374_009429 [Naegleria lovaniensis]|uniref:Uncharacterized protein n=1 Tax=Naegleria lovaniensis TaxID=51637 RepID=A0AA88H4J7_NAELO|nr:uncharacterized protein C9374_009429 [Naegleria lovaniensis]KAG2392852.1 hypothetical protein C9374_009429 [Naegleria lovaniensis]